MYGIIIWLSARAQSALIVTDGGTSLAFGRCTSAFSNPLAVGDLIFAPGLRPDQDEFTAGLTLVIPGFWPEVADSINSNGKASLCHLLRKSGNITHGLVPIKSDNLPCAPNSAAVPNPAVMGQC